MTTTDAVSFPIDGLLVCGACGNKMNIDPQARYACPNSCSTPAVAARELNLLVLGELGSHVINDRSFPTFRHKANEAFEKLKQDDPALANVVGPDDGHLIRLANDTEMLLSNENRADVSGILERSIARVELTAATVTIHYKAPLPDWSDLAGQRHQELALPESFAA